MKTVLFNLRKCPGSSEEMTLCFDEKIVYYGPSEGFDREKAVAEGFVSEDCKGLVAVPGFVDIHNHGGGGYDFIFGNPDHMKKALLSHLLCGTTSVLVTAVSATVPDYVKMFDSYRKLAEDEDPVSSVAAGIHLEGPYLNPNKKGGMVREYLALPVKDHYEQILDAGKGLIRRVTMAPELPGAYELGDKLSSLGIVVSAGHTEASDECLLKAYEHGFTLGTHIFNAMTFHHKEGIFRKSGVAEYLLSDERYDIEAISDGIHVPPVLLNMCWRVKGPGKMALISDAIAAAYPEEVPGRVFEYNGGNVICEDGVAKLSDRSALAGSITSGIKMLRKAVSSGIPFNDAVTMLTKTPARICNIPKVGALRKGYFSDILLINDSLNLVKIYKKGREIISSQYDLG